MALKAFSTTDTSDSFDCERSISHSSRSDPTPNERELTSRKSAPRLLDPVLDGSEDCREDVQRVK
jgi:hypothetical protein